MYTICRKRLIVVSVRSSADIHPRKHIGLFTGYESARAFLDSIKSIATRVDIFH